MAVDIPVLREIVERVFARQDVLEACKRRDLSWPLAVLGANKVTQVQISSVTGIPQGRLSEYKTHKHDPELSTLEAFANGLQLPPAARLAFGLALEPADPGRSDRASGLPADTAAPGLGAMALS
jgi:hypothetical protein